MIQVAVIFLLIFGLFKLQKIIYDKYWDKGLSFELKLSRNFVFEGESVELKEIISNSKFLFLPFVSVIYKIPYVITPTGTDGKPLYLGEERTSIFIINANKSVTKTSRLVCEKRGYYEIGDISISSENIFFNGYMKKDMPEKLYISVYPKEIYVDEKDVPYKKISGEILTKRYTIPDPFEFTGIREYQPFDSFRQINFKAFAKTGTLKSNVYGHTVSQEVKLFLNMQHYSIFKREDVFEEAIKMAAFLARHYLDTGIPLSFMVNGIDCVTKNTSKIMRGLSSNHLHEILEVLARLEISPPERLESIVHELPNKPSEDEVIILISSYSGKDLLDWYINMTGSGGNVLWIKPHSPIDSKITSPHESVILWEVHNND